MAAVPVPLGIHPVKGVMMTIQVSRWVSALSLLLIAPSVHASFIVAPHTAGRDADLSGNTVAAPEDAGSAQFINPAGVVGAPSGQTMFAVAPMNFTAHYADDSRGYRSTSSETPIIMNFWYGLGEWNGWHMGVGTYGSVGTAFDFASDPDNGQTSPYVGKLTVLNLGFNMGRALTEDLRIGFQITPRFGKQSLKAPTPAGDVDFDIDGFGIVGSLGLVYDVSDKLSLGLAYQSTGLVDMEGDGTVGGQREDVEHDLHTPQNVTAGVAYWWSDKTRVMAQMKWTDYNDFERGEVEFEDTAALDQPFIADTKNRIRWGLGLEHEVVPDSWLRVSFSYEPWMIERSSLRPYLFDTRDLMLMAGYEIRYETLSLGFIGGYATATERSVNASQNPVTPGDYGADNDVMAGFRITWHR